MSRSARRRCACFSEDAGFAVHGYQDVLAIDCERDRSVMTTGAESDALAEGYSALRAGRAQDARKIFAAAVAIHGSAEAHEGLGWAALALDDGASTIAARQTAYRLYRASEAPVSAARMAMWLAKDHDDFRGEAALANGWLALARRLLENQPTVPEHGWLLILESWGTTASERDPEIVADGARRAIAVARQCGDRDLELLGIGFEGLALVDSGRVEDGMARLDEAAAAATVGEFDEPLWSLVIFCLLIFACAKVRDFPRAAEWCETMRDLADRMRHTGSQGICRAHYGAVLTQCGNWDRAEETLANAVRYFEASWPPYRAEALADLAELRRRQGRLGEAGELLDRAASVPRAALVRARCALDVGQSENAVDTTERYLRRFPETSAMHRVEGLDVLVRAAVAAGQTSRAETALAELEAIVRRVATPPLLGMANAARATLAAATGRTEDARAGFEDAIDLYARAGLTFDAAVARVDLAELLSALNRGDAARAEIASALAVFDTLGATHLARRAKALDGRFARAMHSERAGDSDERLTPRQVEVLRLVAEGLTNREIATELALSEKTVDRHLSNVFDRLGVSSRAAAVALALEYDVI
jgi:LuxR family transcriptional regulator, maltose regulon positive regulatory protein